MKYPYFWATLIVSLGLLTGCSTGIGRAWNQAWTGTPSEVVSSVQFVDETMGDELRAKYEAIDEAPVTNPDGSVNHQAAENRFRDLAIIHAEIERWDRLSEALADYLGVDLLENANADERRADKSRRKFWEELGKGAREALEDVDDE